MIKVCELDEVVQSKRWSLMMVMVNVMAIKEIIKCFTFGKEEREKQKPRGSR